MPPAFLHGVEVVEIDTGTRPIQVARSSVIGLIGTAPDADPLKWPLNTPVLVAGRRSDASGLGAAGTLSAAVDNIFDQIGAMIVIVRVEDDADPAALTSNIIGGIDDTTGAYEGLQAFLAAESTVGVAPRILIAPEFSNIAAVAAELVSVTERLDGFCYIDGPDTTDAEAIAYRGEFGSGYAAVIDPWPVCWSVEDEAPVKRPPSALFAGGMARSDHERGYWTSPSNFLLNGVIGLSRPVDFAINDPNCRANLLNENEVTTIIQIDGYRMWGNRTCSADPKWAFIKRRRIASMVNSAIMQSHLWAVDRNVTRQYMEEVTEGVNAFGRQLISLGALVDFHCWPDPDLNTPESFEAGQVFFNYDWVETPTAERITFRSMINNGYLTQVLPVAA